MVGVRKYTDKHVNKTFPKLSGRYENVLFYNCKILGIDKSLELIDCVLDQTEFDIPIEELVDFSVTLNCFSFKGVRYSERMIHGLLYLITLTEGNLLLKDKVQELIPDYRLRSFNKVFNNERTNIP